MDHRPVFRVEPSSSELTLSPSPEALRVAQVYQGSSEVWKVKVPQKVREEARARVRHGGGDRQCSQLVLSQHEIQFGQYRGQTFKWLLSHDVGYVVGLVASHQKERESGDVSSSPLMANKDALNSYAKLFPEVMSAVEGRRATEGSTSARSQDQRLVGFGAHAAMTYASLYEATGKEFETYLQWVRKQRCIPGSGLHALHAYVLGRDQENSQPPSQQPQPLPSHTASCDEPSDQMLLATAMEVDTKQVPSSAPRPAGVGDLDLPSSGDSGAVRQRTRAAAAAEGLPKVLKPVTGSELLPHTWRQTLPEEQQDWVGRALFTRNARGQSVLTTDLRLWWYPPGARPLYAQPPSSSHAFFQRPFFLWLPYRMWARSLACPSCGNKLTGAGLYRTVRRVLDRDGWYFMGTEYLECRSCGKKIAAWAQDIISQLDLSHQDQFPAVLTYKLSCHKLVISQMRERTLGNSATCLRKHLVEEHTDTWMSCTAEYLGVLKKLGVPGAAVKPVTVPPMHPVPTVGWLLSVFVRDALTRLEATKARVTSVFGKILKMESTKKMTSKLAGRAAGTAAWVTNVGNEYGQVLMSVLTAAEGDGLLPMAAGLMRRYREAQVAPPVVLYVDHDCCSVTGPTRTATMFSEWDQLVVRLDVWHLMRRFARGVTTESHQLYPQFMARLSYAIYLWDEDDLALLEKAKRVEEGRDCYIRLSAKELARHCRRRTRGAAETERLIQELLDQFWDLRNDLGVALINHGRMEAIWSTQRRHLSCIQDPPGVVLYTQTGSLTKGGIRLPVYRCARGSTSLESFHLHLNRFIPGTSASALHFQVYLLEGLVRWNEDRARASVEGAQRLVPRCYDARRQYDLNQLTQKFMGTTLVETYTQPGEYTGELIGVEYLFSQTGAVLEDFGRDPDASSSLDGADVEVADEEKLDEGFEELQDIHFLQDHQPAAAAASGATDPVSQDDSAVETGMDVTEGDDPDVLGPDGRSGYQHVTALAHALVELRHHTYATQLQAREIVALWQKLSDHDKAPVPFAPRHKDRLVTGCFKSSRSSSTVGVDSVQRSFLGKSAGAAQSPKASRLVEAVFLELCNIHSEGRSLAGVRVSRWGSVLRDYNIIRDVVVSCPTLMANTSIHLYSVNQKTLLQWHTERSKGISTTFLLSTVLGPSGPAAGTQSVPPESLKVNPVLPQRPLQHHRPEDPSGLVTGHHGPVAPALYDLIVSAAMASSASTVTAAPDTIAPLPAIAATTPATAPAATAASSAAAPVPFPRTTAWNRRIREEELRRQRERGLIVKDRRSFQISCRRCGQPKTKQYGHSRYKGENFCSRAEGRSAEEWLEEKRRLDPKNQQPPK